MAYHLRHLKPCLALWIVTAPWYLRRMFPVHSFSNNWTKRHHLQQLKELHQDNNKKMNGIVTTTAATSSKTTETMLYRVKKWQYVFYKHVILHGLNISVALQQQTIAQNSKNNTAIVYHPQWRLFWICLNAAYVLEFFLQSLVKRKVLSQTTMLFLNQWLMVVSSLSALQSVLQVVQWPVCLLSLMLNFVNRHHDVFNTLVVYAVCQVGATWYHLGR